MKYFHTFNRYMKTAVKHTNDLITNNNLDIHPDCSKYLRQGINPRKHNGIMKLSRIQLPNNVESSIKIVIEKYPFKNLKNASLELFNYLWSRKLPFEENEFKENIFKLKELAIQKENLQIDLLSEEEYIKTDEKIKNKVISKLKSQMYNWKPLKYDAFQSMQYLFSRSSFDYAATYRILYELKCRSNTFKPQTILHFGSGVGTSIWAANQLWENKIKEHMCVDQSPDMNTLARLILQGGSENSNPFIQGVYFRQFFSPSPKVKYNIVIAAFTLFELPNKALRLQIIENLWTKSDKYLIIIENGTNSGFQIINEAREYILNASSKTDINDAHVFAPCPHDLMCPRHERNDGTPCNFAVSYLDLDKSLNKLSESKCKYSYVVFEKSARNIQEKPWPRIVRPVKEVSKRVFIRTCTPSGTLEYSVITKKQNSTELYNCAKACSWGDLLPAINREERQHVSDSQMQGDLHQKQLNNN